MPDEYISREAALKDFEPATLTISTGRLRGEKRF